MNSSRKATRAPLLCPTNHTRRSESPELGCNPQTHFPLALQRAPPVFPLNAFGRFALCQLNAFFDCSSLVSVLFCLCMGLSNPKESWGDSGRPPKKISLVKSLASLNLASGCSFGLVTPGFPNFNLFRGLFGQLTSFLRTCTLPAVIPSSHSLLLNPPLLRSSANGRVQVLFFLSGSSLSLYFNLCSFLLVTLSLLHVAWLLPSFTDLARSRVLLGAR